MTNQISKQQYEGAILQQLVKNIDLEYKNSTKKNAPLLLERRFLN